MKLAEYQDLAVSTAQPEAFSLNYLVPMIVGETGELFGQRAKAHWHGWPAEQLELALVLEYGDIAWGTAILLKTYGITDVPKAEAPFMYVTNLWGKPNAPAHTLLRKAVNLNLWFTDEDTHHFIPSEAVQLWETLESLSLDITGNSFDHVLRANADKLKSRAERNVLRGAGDYR